VALVALERFPVWLDPVRTATRPPHDAHNLSLGQSAPIDAKSVDFPARFRIGGPEYELLE